MGIILSKQYIWEFEEEKIKEQEEEEQLLQQQIEKEKHKRKRIIALTIIIIIIFFIILFFAPFFKVEKINVKGNYFFADEKIKSDFKIGERFSLIEVIIKKFQNNKNFPYANYVAYDYDFSEKTFILDVNEKVPFYHNEENINYYYDNRGKVYEWDYNYTTPMVKELDDGIEELFFEQFKKVTFDVRLQINTVEMAPEEQYGKEVIKMSMVDGNTVYIYAHQIGFKMNYYNQMKQILDYENKGPGNIYLYIGDYYEQY